MVNDDEFDLDVRFSSVVVQHERTASGSCGNTCGCSNTCNFTCTNTCGGTCSPPSCGGTCEESICQCPTDGCSGFFCF